MLKKALLISLCALVLFLTYERLNDGFSVFQITSTLPYDQAFETSPPSKENQAKIQALLTSPFHYIGKGCQFYVFASENEEYVIKFFKHKHLRQIPFLEKKNQRRLQRAQKLFSSSKIAYEELSEETGIQLAHLTHTPIFDKKITLIDKLGFKHSISPDNFEFLIQKRALPLKTCFLDLLEKNDAKAIQEHLRAISKTLLTQSAKGVQDADPNFVFNTAFSSLDHQPLLLDVGQLIYDESMKDPERAKKDLLSRLNTFAHWAELHLPALVPYIAVEINDVDRRCGL